MNPRIAEILDEVQGAWRFRWLALASVFGLAALGWVVVFLLPDRYEADASVFVDTRTALKPALQGLALEQDIDDQLNYVRQALLAGPQLTKIAEQSGVLSASDVDARRKQQILAKLQARLDISVQSASDRDEEGKIAGRIFHIEYMDADRARSLRVVTILLDSLVNQTLGGKRLGAEHAQQFLETQIRDYEQRLHSSEDRIAAFKARNFGLLPTEQGGYFERMQKETDAIADIKGKLAKAVSRRAELVKQLHGDAVIAAAAPEATSPGAKVSSDTLTRIAETQARLDELLLKFTDKHPDVVAARQELQELKRRRAAEIEQLRQGDASEVAASGASTNPVFQSIQLALNQADLEITDLRTELSQHESEAEDLRQHINTAPQVQAEFAQLSRDYDVNKAEYTALLQSYEKARLGERADDAGSVRFEVVQPPSASYRPVWPRRTLSLAGVFLGSVVAGMALAYGLHLLQPVTYSANGLAKLADVPVLGVVGVAFPERVKHVARRDLLVLSLATTFLVAALVLVVTLSFAGYRLSIPGQ